MGSGANRPNYGGMNNSLINGYKSLGTSFGYTHKKKKKKQRKSNKLDNIHILK
jgi:hypothetical protein